MISELLTLAFVCGKNKPKMNIPFVGEPKSLVILRVDSTILLPKRSAIKAILIDKKPKIQAL